MAEREYPAEFLIRLKAITGKRPATVIAHILEHGFITTDELKAKYGYEHPPRAARDVREHGIPLETFRVRNEEGRNIAAYRFGDPSDLKDTLAGRKTFPKQFKQELVDRYGSKCFVCLTTYEERYLQIDHRVPYEVSGDPTEPERSPREYMLVCGSCNRAKSWSCEHCENWHSFKSSGICMDCYWGSPDSYKHVALKDIRRLDVVWTDSGVRDYDDLRQQASSAGLPVAEYVKALLARNPVNRSEEGSG